MSIRSGVESAESGCFKEGGRGRAAQALTGRRSIRRSRAAANVPQDWRLAWWPGSGRGDPAESSPASSRSTSPAAENLAAACGSSRSSPTPQGNNRTWPRGGGAGERGRRGRFGRWRPVLALSIRSMPRLSPAAPSMVNRRSASVPSSRTDRRALTGGERRGGCTGG
jgi:hypothetical protein